MSGTESPEVTLQSGLRKLHLGHGPAASKQLLAFARLLLKTNETTNLTGARSLHELVTSHILDSLAPLKHLKLLEPVVDVGSGGGFPGVPAAIIFERHRFILLEPRRKRAEFLRAALSDLEIHNAKIEQMSAGTAGQKILKEGAGTVLMRAVAKPEASLRLGLPLVRPGGMLLLYEGRAAKASADAIRTAHELHASLTIRPVDVPYLEAERHLWIVRKKLGRSTPKRRSRSGHLRST